MLKFVFVLLCLCNISYAQPHQVLLAIFAHPDDEEIISPVLAKYAAQGIDVYIAVATDGRLGVAKHANVPAGDSLAAVRKQEMICAAAKLGIHPPIFMGMHDQLRMQEGNDAFTGQLDTIRNTVKKLFTELKPDVVITWGASGWTGHADHRLVGDIVTEIFESKIWDHHPTLVFPALPTEADAKVYPSWLSTVDSSYLTVKIPVTKKDVDKSTAAFLCHKTQYTPDDVTMLSKWWWRPYFQNGVIWFRAYQSTGRMQNSLFP